MAFGNACPAPSINCQLGALYIRNAYSWFMYRLPWTSSRSDRGISFGGGGGGATAAMAFLGFAAVVFHTGAVVSAGSLLAFGNSGRTSALVTIGAGFSFFGVSTDTAPLVSALLVAGRGSVLLEVADGPGESGIIAAILSFSTSTYPKSVFTLNMLSS